MTKSDSDELIRSLGPEESDIEILIKRLVYYCWSLTEGQLRGIAKDTNKQSLVLASGEAKAKALHTALRAGLFSSAIIDEELALALLRL